MQGVDQPASGAFNTPPEDVLETYFANRVAVSPEELSDAAKYVEEGQSGIGIRLGVLATVTGDDAHLLELLTPTGELRAHELVANFCVTAMRALCVQRALLIEDYVSDCKYR